MDPTDVELRISYLEKPQPRRRLRFVGVESESPASGRVTVTVTLEWRGALIRGTAEGESSLVGDLRVCAYATLQALTSVLDGGTQFDLVGIKSTRIFDTDLIAVVLDCADVPGRRLIGASLVAVDQKRSAVLSVLHATNRVLGNYLTTSD